MIIELYRGLMNILIEQNTNFEKEMIEHIRPFHNKKPVQSSESTVLNGFWNFMLEVCMILFSKFFFVFGIFLITFLAILFFPLDFIMRASTIAARDGHYPHTHEEINSEPKIEPKIEPEKK